MVDFYSKTDDFTGTNGDAPDSTLWSLNVDIYDDDDMSSSDPEIQGNRVRLTGSFPEDSTVYSKFEMSGDFVMQVDFEADLSNTETRFFGWIDENNYVQLQVDNANARLSSYSKTGGVAGDYSYVSRTNNYGSFRITRTGTTYKMEAKDGTGSWQTIDTITGGPSGDMHAVMYGFFISSYVYFDNFSATWGGTVECVPFESSTVFTADYSLFIPEISCPALESTTVLSAAMDLEISAPAFSSVTAFGDVGYTVFEAAKTKFAYLFTLTGAVDGEDDVIIPMSSFQCRRRSGVPTYLSVTIPTIDYADQITARPNGTMRVDIVYLDSTGAVVSTAEIVSADLDNVDLSEGTSSASVVLTGYKTETYETKSVTITDSIYRRVNDGKYRHRLARPQTDLNPGDTVTISGDTFVVYEMSYSISPKSQTMEIAEAA